jgi:hypothetical protein
MFLKVNYNQDRVFSRCNSFQRLNTLTTAVVIFQRAVEFTVGAIAKAVFDAGL